MQTYPSCNGIDIIAIAYRKHFKDVVAVLLDTTVSGPRKARYPDPAQVLREHHHQQDCSGDRGTGQGLSHNPDNCLTKLIVWLDLGWISRKYSSLSFYWSLI